MYKIQIDVLKQITDNQDALLKAFVSDDRAKLAKEIQVSKKLSGILKANFPAIDYKNGTTG